MRKQYVDMQAKLLLLKVFWIENNIKINSNSIKIALEQNNNSVIKYSVSKKGLGGSAVLFKAPAQITT